MHLTHSHYITIIMLKGIINSGNDCYFIATLQALYNIPEYVEYLLTSNTLSKYEKVAHITYKLLQKNKPLKVLDLFRIIDPVEFNGSQKDASEFMIRLFDNYVDNHKKTLPHIVFRRECLLCHKVNTSESLLFPIWVEKNNNANFIIPEPNKFLGDTFCEIEKDCEKCKHKTHSEKNGFRDKGNVLFMAIKRFNYNGSKDNSPIENIALMLNDKELRSVVCHYGNTFSGHYFTINNINDKWIIFDDEKVEEMEEKKAWKFIQHLGYILIYKKKLMV